MKIAKISKFVACFCSISFRMPLFTLLDNPHLTNCCCCFAIRVPIENCWPHFGPNTFFCCVLLFFVWQYPMNIFIFKVARRADSFFQSSLSKLRIERILNSVFVNCLQDDTNLPNITTSGENLAPAGTSHPIGGRANVLNRVGHQQDKWKRQVREQRRNIYDRHTMLNWAVTERTSSYTPCSMYNVSISINHTFMFCDSQINVSNKLVRNALFLSSLSSISGNPPLHSKSDQHVKTPSRMNKNITFSYKYSFEFRKRNRFILSKQIGYILDRRFLYCEIKFQVRYKNRLKSLKFNHNGFS